MVEIQRKGLVLVEIQSIKGDTKDEKGLRVVEIKETKEHPA